MRNILSRPAAFFGTALLLSLSACTTQIISGVGSGPTGTGGGGGGTTGSVTSTAQSTGTGGPPTLTAVALTGAQQNALWDQYWNTQYGGSGGGSGSSLNPNDLFLHLSDVGVTCASPTVTLPCGLHYEASFLLSPASQQVGVYDIDSGPEVRSNVRDRGNPIFSDPTGCNGLVGSIGSGSLEIISIDPTEVHFKVSGTSNLHINPSGDFIAPRCP